MVSLGYHRLHFNEAGLFCSRQNSTGIDRFSASIVGSTIWLTLELLKYPPLKKTEQVLGYPPLAWFLYNGILWGWHFPAFYNAALNNERIHIFQHITFLVSAAIFWWQLLAPPGYRHLASLPALFYSYLAAIANSTLGAILTFAPLRYYRHYIHPEDKLSALPLIRDNWGLSAQGDQQLGGLFMWEISGAIFLWAIMVIYARWYRGNEVWYRSSEIAVAG